MAVIHTNNFDAETTGALPSGWANKTGTWVVGTNGPVSGAKTLGSSSNGDGDAVLYTGAAAIADMQIDTSQKAAVFSGGRSPNIGHLLRMSSTYQNGYAVVISGFNGTSALALLFKRVGGSYSQVGSNVSVSITASVGDVIRLRTRCVGTSFSVYFWNATTGSMPGTPSASWTDASVSAAGYAGLYNGLDTITGTPIGADDFVLDDTAAGASAVTLTGPTSGTVGVASTNFTVGANGSISGTVVVTPSDGGAGGTFTPATVSISSGTPTATFTYTAASAGAKTISVTNDGGLTNPSSITYTATAAAVTVAVTDAAWKFSPYNWDTNGSAKIAVNGGAYFKLGFTGTSVSIGLDVSSLVAGSVAAGWYPSLRYSVDNGPQTDVQLTSGTTALTVSGLASGTHSIEVFYLAGWWENIGGTAPDRWTTPVYCIKVTGATLDAGASTVAPQWEAGNAIWFGDSISEGIRANYSTTQPTCQNAYESVPIFVGRALGCEMGNVSFGGQSYTGGFNSVPAFNTAYSSFYSGRSRLSGGLFSPAPDYIFIWHGANGGTTSASVQTAIGNMRAAAAGARICVLVPVGGFDRAAITAGVAAYLAANASERKVHLIDLGTAWQAGLDGFGSATQQAIDKLHPRANWNSRIAAAYTKRISALAATTTATRTITLTLTTDGSTPAASLSSLKWSFWDQATPDAMSSPPSDYGVAETTDGSGVLTISARSTLTAGQVGWLIVTNSDGNPATNHSVFAGPVTVS